MPVAMSRVLDAEWIAANFISSSLFLTVVLTGLFFLIAAVVELSGCAWKRLRGKCGTRASLLLAYQIVTCTGNLMLAVAGFAAWFTWSPYAEVSHKLTAAERLWGRSAYIEAFILVPLAAHLASDLIMYISLAELRDPMLVLHHAITGALTYFALQPVPFVQHYCTFYAGVCELSNVPLALVELCKLMPSLRPSLPRGAEPAARLLFALSFVALRMVYWPIVTVQYWRDSLDALSGVLPSQLQMFFYLGSNAVLTGMQLVWGLKVASRLLAELAKLTGLAPATSGAKKDE